MYAWNRIPMYEGDSVIRSGPVPASPGTTLRRSPEGAISRSEIEQRARKLRWETLADLLGNIVERVRRGAQSARSRELDSYLSRATSLADVERLLKEAEREGRFFQD